MTLVCWSGGCDSTLVLWDLAQKASPQKPVRAVSFDVSQVNMGKEQARARKRILARMKKNGLHVEHTNIKIDSGEGFIRQAGSPQAVLWLIASQALETEEDLYLGIVAKDDWWISYSSWYSVFNTLQSVAERTGVIVTPLGGTPKRVVLKYLEKAGLLDLTWWCAASDLPKNKLRKTPCGECSSCIAHETALWQRERFGT